MLAVILAGGLGTRLRSVTGDTIPKVMAIVQGKPFIYWQLQYLKKQGIKKIILAVHHLADQVHSFVGDDFEGIEVVYSFEKTPLGTGGAVRLALDQLDRQIVLILNGDTWFPVNLNSMLSTHQKSENQVTIALKKLHHFDRYGSVTLNKNQRIIHFIEKRAVPEGYINGGIYLLDSDLMKPFEYGQRFSLEHDLFEEKVKTLVIGGFKSKAKFIDIGIPSDYHEIQTFKLV